MALKVSVLVFYPLLSLIPMNNQQGIKLKSKQYLLHVLEEVECLILQDVDVPCV